MDGCGRWAGNKQSYTHNVNLDAQPNMHNSIYIHFSYYGQSIISHCIQVHSTPHFHIRDSQSSHTVYKYTVLHTFMLWTVNHLTLYTSTLYSTLSCYGQSIISHCIQVHSTPHFHIRDSQSSHTVYKYTLLHTFILWTVNHLTLYTSTQYSHTFILGTVNHLTLYTSTQYSTLSY